MGDWLANHVHTTFAFTSISKVRLLESPNDAFKKLLGSHSVKEWSGRLSWNPKLNRGSNKLSKHRKAKSLHIPNSKLTEQPIVTAPSINWKLWQLTRLDVRQRNFESCVYANNIGLAKRNNGCLISTR